MAVKTQPKNTTYIEFDLAQSLTFSSYKFVYEYSYLKKRVHVPKKKKKCKPSSGYSGYRKSRLKFVTHHSSPLLKQYFPAVSVYRIRWILAKKLSDTYWSTFHVQTRNRKNGNNKFTLHKQDEYGTIYDLNQYFPTANGLRGQIIYKKFSSDVYYIRTDFLIYTFFASNITFYFMYILVFYTWQNSTSCRENFGPNFFDPSRKIQYISDSQTPSWVQAKSFSPRPKPWVHIHTHQLEWQCGYCL